MNEARSVHLALCRTVLLKACGPYRLIIASVDPIPTSTKIQFSDE